MRCSRLVPCLALILAASATGASAQQRYIQFNGATVGLVDGGIDGIVTQNLTAGKVTSTQLDLCFGLLDTSRRMDRVVLPLAANSNTFTGSGTSVIGKANVSVSLVINAAKRDAIKITGEVRLPGSTLAVSSENNTYSQEAPDLSGPGDVTIAQDPNDVSQVSPNTVVVRASFLALPAVLAALKTEPVTIAADTLVPDCSSLRSGVALVSVTVAPSRAEDLVKRLSAVQGVLLAGWSTGDADPSNAVRFKLTPDLTKDGRIDEAKAIARIAEIAAKALQSTVAEAPKYDERSGKYRVTFQRPSSSLPGSGLNEMTEISFMIAPEQLHKTDSYIVYATGFDESFADPEDGAKWQIFGSGGEGDTGYALAYQRRLAPTVVAIARELKGDVWNSDQAVWKAP